MKRKSHIARRLIIAMVLFSTLITIVTSSYQLYSDFQRDVDHIYEKFGEIEKVHINNLANQVWIADETEIRRQMESILNLPDIVYLEISESGKTWLKAGMHRDEKVLDMSMPIFYTYKEKKTRLADLKVQATLENAYQHVIDQVWDILISNAIKTFLVTGFMFIIFQYLVTRHLLRISEHAENLSLDNLAKHLTLNRKTKPPGDEDELDTVVNSLERMQKNLLNSLDQIHERDVRLSIYEKIMSTTSDLMSFIDRDYKYLAVNQAYSELFNKNYDDIVGHSVEELLGKDYFENVVKPRFDQVFLGKTYFYDSVIQLHGNTMPVEVTYLPYYGEDEGNKSEVQGVVVHARNISDRVRHHQIYTALARNPASDFQQFLNDSVKLIAEVFHVKLAFVGRLLESGHEIKTETLYMDGKFKKQVTYDVKGTPCGDVIHKGKVFIQDNVISAYPDDAMLDDINAESYFGVSIVDNEGSVIGLFSIIHDEPLEKEDMHEEILSVFAARVAIEMERHDALLALQAYQENLEQEVDKRTRDLITINKEMESFAYSVSHDLRTPLRAINGYCAALVEDCADELSETAMEYLNRVKNASLRMSALIDGMLKLSRISRQEMVLEEIDITRLANDVIAEIAAGRNIQHYKIEVEAGMKARGDKKLLAIAVLNLLENAIKYASREEQPHIKFYKQGAGFLVQDNGIGFDMRYKDKLFVPFQRLHDDKDMQGIGIGLANVFRIIMRHQGSISLESEVAKGTSVYFTLSV